MKIDVIDTPRAMLDILARPLGDRRAALRELIAPMYEHVPMPGDPVDLHHQGGGFRVDADDDRYVPALEHMVAEDVVGRIERELHRASDALREWQQPDEVKVLFALGHPDDEHLMKITGGYYGMGGAPGWLYLIAYLVVAPLVVYWPTHRLLQHFYQPRGGPLASARHDPQTEIR